MKMMFNKIIITGIILTCFIAIFSCENSLFLGDRLDLAGPVINFTSPQKGASVIAQFYIEGNITETLPSDTGVKTILLTVQKNNADLSKQWRFTKNGSNFICEVSQDYGETWTVLSDAEWNGDSYNANWKIFIDLSINGEEPEEGQYQFTLQAWDNSNNSDDNSYRTLVVVLDNNPPYITIVNPYTYSGYIIYDGISFSDSELENIHNMSGDDWKDPAMIGKFQTRSFNLQYQIDDYNQISSFDLRFYNAESLSIDQDASTDDLPDNYIYRYVNSNYPQKLNDTIVIPALNGTPGTYDKGGELKNPVTGKTTIAIVSVCYDSAGNINQEKRIGYIPYWPEADFPWITFTADLKPVSEYINIDADDDLKEDIFMIYPGRTIRANAYHYYGVEKVIYSLSVYNAASKELTPVAEFQNITNNNTERGDAGSGMYSTSFQFEIESPPRTAFYVVQAKAYGVKESAIAIENISDVYEGVFLVQDISFPDFTTPVSPAASDPIFMSMGRDGAPDINKIRIHGRVADATEITKLYLVWINPESEEYRAMSQLRYFREPNYAGWKVVETPSVAPLGTYREEGLYDPSAPNKVWNVAFSFVDINENNRMEYEYSQIIDLTDHMDIGKIDSDGKRIPLGSQTFLLRAENPDGKTTIITYAPQGDMSPPEISITEVVITGDQNTICPPGGYALIEQFSENDIITINGEWTEDSIGYLPFEDYLKENFKVEVNNIPSSDIDITFTPSTGNATGGTWKVVIDKVSTPGFEDLLKDTLSVSTELTDIGGNISTHSASWLIRTDTIDLMRISSNSADTKYKEGETINIFFEFNKPVQLKNNDSAPKLLLNISGAPVYADYVPDVNYNTRQNFTYTVGEGHATEGNFFLDVIGINTNGIDWEAVSYPFTWITAGADSEEIRITDISGHNGTKPAGKDFHARKLPLYSGVPAEQVLTLRAGKSIEIDTSSPVINNITSSNPTGHYSSGQLYINVTFSELIKLNGTIPQLNLGGGGFNKTTTGPVTVNGSTVTFSYEIITGDTTEGNQLTVTGIHNFESIQDLAGNSISDISSPQTVLTTPAGGIFIDTTTPGAPVVKIITTDSNTHGGYTNVLSNTISGTPTPARTDTGAKMLQNVYESAIWLALDGAGSGYQIGQFEYTIDNTASPVIWTRVPESRITGGNTFVLPIEKSGTYRIAARQISKAGNTSASSDAISFTYDPGAFVTYITSTSANNTYTQNAGRNSINITISFRKPVTFNAGASFTLNARNAGNTVYSFNMTGTASTATATYTVAAGDKTNNDVNILDELDVTAITAPEAEDAQGVNISSYITLPAASASRLAGNKEIYIDTRALTYSTPEISGTVQSDGTFSGTLTVEFNRRIYKGATTNNLTVTQISGTDAASYFRLPAVITEAQYNRVRSVSGIDSFYTRGTNGYIPGEGSDTSTKYVLMYSIDTADVTPDEDEAAGSIEKFADDYRLAEAISLPVNSGAVTITGAESNILTISLTGSNVLQVPGATYAVNIPANFIVDDLDYSNIIIDPQIAISGVAKPYIRVNKVQDIITTATASQSQPRLVATQPLQTEARIDCRTPGAEIIYNATGSPHTVSLDTGNTGNDATNHQNGTNWRATGDDPIGNTPAPPATPDDPETSGTTYDTSEPITIGENNYNGLQYYLRAKARTGSEEPYTWSADSYEMAYKTVLSYRIRDMQDGSNDYLNMNNRLNTNGTYDDYGDQIWIRGGDDIGTSTVPGFPLTWEDDFTDLNGKRAGIRLLTKRAGGDALMRTNSVWSWVTWEVNVPVYFDMILGRDVDLNQVVDFTASDADEAWQYGPRFWALQRAGWTSYKEQYKMLPGKHRYLYVCGEHSYESKGAVNFSGTFRSRTPLTVSGWNDINTAGATPAP